MIILIDGNNTVIRNDSVSELYTKSGRRVSGIFGTIRELPVIIKNVESLVGKPAQDLKVIFDGGRNDFRLKAYPDYKGNRTTDQSEEAMLKRKERYAQVDYLHEHLHKFGIPSLKLKGHEADDLIYALTEIINDRVKVIVSTDKDFLQLVSDQVFVYNPIKRQLITPSNFKEITGVAIQGYLAYKMMLGDSSDNIPGINGIGEKTGQRLMEQYGTLPNLLNHPAELLKSKVTARIFSKEGLEILQRNRILMDLSVFNYQEIKTSLDEFNNKLVYMNEPAIKDLIKENQFSSLLVGYSEFITKYRELNDIKMESSDDDFDNL